MFEAKVIIDLPGIADAINNLADAIRTKGSVTTTVDAPEHKTRAKRQKAEKPVEEQAVESEPNFTPVESSEPEPSFIAEVPPDEVEDKATQGAVASEPVAVPQSAPPAPVKKYTFKQLSNAGAKLVADMGKMEQLVKLLNDKYGVPAITMIPEERYPELADDLIALGAEIKEE